LIEFEQPNTYSPTPGEQKLLDVLMDPESRVLTVTARCEKAGVDRTVYYDAFKKPGFVRLYRDMCVSLISQNLGPIIRAFEKEAMKGSYNHGKVLLEMAGLYTEKKEVSGPGGGPIQLAAVQTASRRLEDAVADISARRLAAGSTGEAD
jgi:hypothetical protein